MPAKMTVSRTTLHHSTPQTSLPAHEKAARRRRAATAQLPGIPGHRKSRTPKPVPATGSKTIHVDAPNLPRPRVTPNP